MQRPEQSRTKHRAALAVENNWTRVCKRLYEVVSTCSASSPPYLMMSALTSSMVCRSLWYASFGGSFSSVINRST